MRVNIDDTQNAIGSHKIDLCRISRPAFQMPYQIDFLSYFGRHSETSYLSRLPPSLSSASPVVPSPPPSLLPSFPTALAHLFLLPRISTSKTATLFPDIFLPLLHLFYTLSTSLTVSDRPLRTQFLSQHFTHSTSLAVLDFHHQH